MTLSTTSSITSVISGRHMNLGNTVEHVCNSPIPSNTWRIGMSFDPFVKWFSSTIEFLRLTTSDNQGVRSKTPFVLLGLNRHLDCYHFIKWWAINGLNDEEIELWQEGHWPYSAVSGAPTEDLFKVLDSLDPQYFDLAHLAALALIQFRAVAAFQVQQGQLKALQDCRVIDEDIFENVQQMMLGDKSLQLILHEQDAHLQKYLGYIQARNPTLLPAIVNPGPMRQQSPPSYYSPGSAAEAYLVFNDCCRHFARVPYALKLIEDFFGRGPNPTYDCNMDMMR